MPADVFIVKCPIQHIGVRGPLTNTKSTLDYISGCPLLKIPSFFPFKTKATIFQKYNLNTQPAPLPYFTCIKCPAPSIHLNLSPPPSTTPVAVHPCKPANHVPARD